MDLKKKKWGSSEERWYQVQNQGNKTNPPTPKWRGVAELEGRGWGEKGMAEEDRGVAGVARVTPGLLPGAWEASWG